MLVHAIQMHGKIVRPIIDREFRDADGVLAIPSDACARLIVEHMPEANLPTRGGLRSAAANSLARRRGRAARPRQPLPSVLPASEGLRRIRLRLSIDPIDSRFIDRTSLDIDRIHLVQDDSIVSMAHRRRSDSRTIEQEHGRVVGTAVRSMVVGILGAGCAVNCFGRRYASDRRRRARSGNGGGEAAARWLTPSWRSRTAGTAQRVRKSWKL